MGFGNVQGIDLKLTDIAKNNSKNMEQSSMEKISIESKAVEVNTTTKNINATPVEELDLSVKKSQDVSIDSNTFNAEELDIEEIRKLLKDDNSDELEKYNIDKFYYNHDDTYNVFFKNGFRLDIYADGSYSLERYLSNTVTTQFTGVYSNIICATAVTDTEFILKTDNGITYRIDYSDKKILSI